jgi:hypothetical protein
MSLPNPDQVYYELQTAIQQNKRPCIMLKEFLDSGSLQANVLNSQIFGNKRALKLLTSPEGRAWIKIWMDDFLNYLAIIARS